MFDVTVVVMMYGVCGVYCWCLVLFCLELNYSEAGGLVGFWEIYFVLQ